MSENLETFKIKRYMEFNKVIIALAISMIFLPLIVLVIRYFFPNAIRCFYYEFTSRACPFCGITTDFRSILKGSIFSFKYNILSIPLIVGAVFEIFCRAWILFKEKYSRKYLLNTIVKLDLFVHLIFSLLIISYVIFFFVFDLRRF